MTKPIPLVVIGGFLGAGKTTLLNSLLTNANALRVGVLVNDFGPINVDAELVAEHDGETLSLTNGCVCCSMGSGLEDALIRVLDRTLPMDLIVIEASGVSDPGRIAQVGLSDPLLQLTAVITIVDAEHVVEQLDDPLLADTLERQINAASLVLLNKVDLVSQADLEMVRSRLERQFGVLALMETQEAQIPLDLLLGETTDTKPNTYSMKKSLTEYATSVQDEPDHPFEGGVWSSQGVLEADRLIEALKSLPKTVIRAKGWVTTDRHGSAQVHLAGGRVRITRSPPRSKGMANELIYIGMRETDIDNIIRKTLAFS